MKIGTVIFGIMCILVWSLSVGYVIGWGYEKFDYCSPFKALLRAFMSVAIESAAMYMTCRIIFVITSRSFQYSALLVDLHKCVARTVACTALGVSTWAMSLAWVMKDDCEYNLGYHACNYGLIVSALVAGLAGGLWSVTAREAAMQTREVVTGANRYTPEPVPLPKIYFNTSFLHPTKSTTKEVEGVELGNIFETFETFYNTLDIQHWHIFLQIFTISKAASMKPQSFEQQKHLCYHQTFSPLNLSI